MYVCYVYFNKDQSFNQSIKTDVADSRLKATCLTSCLSVYNVTIENITLTPDLVDVDLFRPSASTRETFQT